MERKRKKCNSVSTDLCQDTKMQNNIRPNIFLGIKLFNNQVIESVNNLQKIILKNNPKLCANLIKLSKLHLTLKTYRIEKCEEDIERIKNCMSICYQNIKEIYEPIILTISGLDHFRGNVLFLKISKNSELEKIKDIADKIDLIFSENGFISTDNRPFNPHITILKLSKSFRFKKEIKKVCDDMGKEYGLINLGSEVVKGIQICWISEEQDFNEYYTLIDEFIFDNSLKNQIKDKSYDQLQVQVIEEDNISLELQ